MPVAIRPGVPFARAVLAAAAALLLALLLARAATPAHAQLDPTGGRALEIWQAGERVGEVYVPARPPGATDYVEHWVLFPGYVYPSGDGKVGVELRPGGPAYESEADFFARVPFARGARYVEVKSYDTERLPGR